MPRTSPLLLLLLLAACNVSATIDGPDDPDAAPPIEVPPAFGVITAPRVGEVHGGAGPSSIVEVAGMHTDPGLALEIVILAPPFGTTDWTVAATTTTDTEPTALGGESMYGFRAEIAPGAAWPLGGLLRLRVRPAGGEGDELVALADDDACLDASDGDAWRDRIAACGGFVTGGLALVSPTPSPLERRYLDDKGTLTVDETLAYYASIDAPATAADFAARHGLGAGDAVHATYYNAGDLGIGREMMCAAIDAGGVACLVRNYGDFGGAMQQALDGAWAGALSGGDGAFASVAMVYTPPITAPDAVQFMVYGPGPDGALIAEAQLDTHGDNVSIPNNCLNCHGSSATFTGGAVQNARFLAFDPAAFVFPDRAGYRRADQEAELRQLNALIAATEPAPATTELIEGWYGGDPAATAAAADDAWVPPGWRGSTADEAAYRHVVGPYCRTCHASRDDDLDFATAAGFRQRSATITASVCGAGEHPMPSAEAVLEQFWDSPARAYLAAFFGDSLASACAP